MFSLRVPLNAGLNIKRRSIRLSIGANEINPKWDIQQNKESGIRTINHGRECAEFVWDYI